MNTNYLTFLSQLPSHFVEIGSLIPSGSALADVITKPLQQPRGPKRILEVGPGTGPFTRKVLSLLQEDDSFVIAEINKKLLRNLEESLKTNEDFQKHREQITFFEGPVQQLLQSRPPASFDTIICSLPFLNFPAPLADEIMELFYRSLAPHGTLSFFEYAGLKGIVRRLSLPKNKKRVREVETAILKWKDRAAACGSLERKLTLKNFPPANTYFLQFS